MNFKLLLHWILAAFLLASICSFAEAIAIKKSAQGIEFATGGIGEDEVDSLRPLIKKFSLHMVFSEGVSGRSATDVDVSIYDANNILAFRVSGAQPQLLVNLPPNTYTIAAKYNGDKLRHKFTLNANESQKIILNWKNVTEDDLIRNEDSHQDVMTEQ